LGIYCKQQEKLGDPILTKKKKGHEEKKRNYIEFQGIAKILKRDCLELGGEEKEEKLREVS